MKSSVLFAFLPTFLFVSITPGMCMILSLTLGMSIGLRKSLWMMLGELAGVGLVAALSLFGVASIMLQYPSLFVVFKVIGACYLAYIGYQMWVDKGKLSLNNVSDTKTSFKAVTLINQGFFTAIANPKGWAFFITLLPPFVDYNQAIPPQAAILVTIILVIEWLCLVLYNLGGRTLKNLLKDRSNVKFMNRFAGSLVIGVAIWLVLG